MSKPQPPAELLWHYTNWDAGDAILRDGRLRGSHIRYLNDAQEFKWIAHIVGRAFRKLEAQLRHSRAMRHHFLSVVEHQQPEVYVTSFSEAADSLSQWRAYGGATLPVALGFDRGALVQAVPLAFRLEECIYDEEEQVEKVRQILVEADAKYDHALAAQACAVTVHEPGQQRAELNRRAAHVNAVLIAAAKRLVELAPVLKHGSFSHEHEYRLVVTLDADGKREYRRGGTLVIPYVDYAVLRDPSSAALREAHSLRHVMLGPNPHNDLNLDAVRQLLCNAGFAKQVQVSASQTPFRNW
jgi:Protein of unknown function (DUF2971)